MQPGRCRSVVQPGSCRAAWELSASLKDLQLFGMCPKKTQWSQAGGRLEAGRRQAGGRLEAAQRTGWGQDSRLLAGMTPGSEME